MTREILGILTLLSFTGLSAVAVSAYRLWPLRSVSSLVRVFGVFLLGVLLNYLFVVAAFVHRLSGVSSASVGYTSLLVVGGALQAVGGWALALYLLRGGRNFD